MDETDYGVVKVMQDMSSGGHGEVAASVKRHLDAAAEEGDVPIKADSLRGLSNLLDLLKAREPEIGTGPDGLMQAYWKRADGGSLATEFLDDDTVSFSILYGDRLGGGPERSLSGTMPLARAAVYVGEFIHTGPARGERDGRGR